jgi:D-alanine-D-alanine ligase
VEQRWHALKQSWFGEYCWPLTRDTYVKWSDHPEDWRPINHSCDPNTWLEGLDLVARRNIAPDEALTLEYATFCGPTMKSIQPCRCGTSACRGAIHGTDHLLPQIRERYADHVSDYVRAAWRRAGVPARSSAVST